MSTRTPQSTGSGSRRLPADHDGRVAYLHLTPEGERRLASAFTRLDVERHSSRGASAQLER